MHNLTIVSGGQTGVDRAALDVALWWKVTIRGWCPAGRWAEDGPISERYPLTCTAERAPAVRTCRNVDDSDVLLVFNMGAESAGTSLAVAHAAASNKPVIHAQPATPVEAVLEMIVEDGLYTVNAAGPRESEAPGIYSAAATWFYALLYRAQQRFLKGPDIIGGVIHVR